MFTFQGQFTAELFMRSIWAQNTLNGAFKEQPNGLQIY